MAVLPTKGNLIATKHSLELANTGFELMDRKRNILTREMMGLISRAEKIQSRIDSTFSEAYDALMLANISMGKTIHLAEQVPVDDSVEIRYRSVMGVEIPTVSAKPAQQPLQAGLFLVQLFPVGQCKQRTAAAFFIVVQAGSGHGYDLSLHRLARCAIL